jgi:phosphoesterase RecJ-like protein
MVSQQLDDPAALQRVADTLRGARRIASLCHENPDADTLGAALAVALIAERLGKEYEIVCADRPAPMYSFLPRFDQIVSEPTGLADVAVVCDAATLERIGPIASRYAAWLARTEIVNIDHHVTNLGFGTANLVDATAAATCEIVAALLPELGIELDAELATALLAGIVRDTNGFADASTSPRTLRHTANLLEAGAPLAEIYRIILDEMPYERMLLWGKLLHELGQRHGGRVIFACLTQAMLDETNTEQPDADGVAEFIAQAKGADITLLLREVGAQATRVSIRTSAAVSAADIARPFAGGGHLRRAGCTVQAALQQAVIQVLEVCDAQLSEDAVWKNANAAKLAGRVAEADG